MTGNIVELMRIPPQLTLEFLATFARFEFALKKAGYTSGREQSVQPDWARLGRELAQSEAALDSVFCAAKYLEAHPPLKQVKREGLLAWDRLNTEPTRIERILFDLRTVRNNLFHGGKFRDGLVEEPCRDEHLIRCCLAILNALLAIPTLSNLVQHFMPEG